MLQDKSKLRILITPNLPNPYDQRMVKGLSEGFAEIGCYSRALHMPIDSYALLQLCEQLSINVVIQVNRSRDLQVELPAHIRHVAWYQDVFPETTRGFFDPFRESDLLYTLGDAEVLGLQGRATCFVGSLLTGVARRDIRLIPPSKDRVDFSLCGYIPPPLTMAKNLKADFLWYCDYHLRGLPAFLRVWVMTILRRGISAGKLPPSYIPYVLMRDMKYVVDSFYQPLCGSLDIQELADAMRCVVVGDKSLLASKTGRKYRALANFARILEVYQWQVRSRPGLLGAILDWIASHGTVDGAGVTPVESAINYFAQTYPRGLDRMALIDNILEVSQSLELYGDGWQSYPAYKKYFKGKLESNIDLFNVYRRSRVNLSNNTHGLGLHSRVLECMAVGGFIFNHTSSNDTKPGGMLTAFEPNVHYGSYTPDNIIDEAQRWLVDEKERLSVGIRASEAIRNAHCWSHRAEQIVGDLSR